MGTLGKGCLREQRLPVPRLIHIDSRQTVVSVNNVCSPQSQSHNSTHSGQRHAVWSLRLCSKLRHWQCVSSCGPVNYSAFSRCCPIGSKAGGLAGWRPVQCVCVSGRLVGAIQATAAQGAGCRGVDGITVRTYGIVSRARAPHRFLI